MFCRKCGKEVPDNAEFCPWCGEILTPGLQQESGDFLTRPIKIKQRTKKFLIRLLCLFCLYICVAVCIIVIYAIVQVKNETGNEDSTQQVKEAGDADSAKQASAVDSTWSIRNVTDSFGDAVEGRFIMTARFDGTYAAEGSEADVFVVVEIAEYAQNNLSPGLFKGFLMGFTPVKKATGQPFLHYGTEATIEIKANDVKYVLLGSVSGNSIMLNDGADLNHAMLPGAVENNIDTQELLHIIYTSDSDVEFVLNKTFRFTLHKGNFNKVFDEADWQDPSEISGNKENNMSPRG